MLPTKLPLSSLTQLLALLLTVPWAPAMPADAADALPPAALNLITRDQPHPPQFAGGMFEHSPEIEIELVAHEPNVIDPVAARFDGQGRLWVVEMRDYPTGPVAGGKPNGSIRVLRDLDDDGFYEHAVVFAAGLEFPTGIQPWREGVIVTLAGRIGYWADTDGDDRSDVQQTWFTGFAQDNTQLRVNHPVLGSDGRIYVAGGLRGSTVTSADPRWSGGPVQLLHNDFSLDPSGGDWGAVAGDSQYGLLIDDFGRRIGVSNRNPAKLAVIPLALVEHDPWMSPGSALFDISPAGAESSVRPVAEAWTTSNLHAGQFSAACGVHSVAATSLPDSWQGNLLTCEPTGYLVQRAAVDAGGAVPRATPVFDPGEAIASRDTWFRPVDITDGPDGALYIVDMHRAVIEHPEWAPQELKHRVDERYGDQAGRIYRIRGRGASRLRHEPSLTAQATPQALVRHLDHPNGWHRAEAARLLVQAGPQAADDLAAGLPQLVTAAGLARAAALLAHWNRLPLAECGRLAEHDDPRLRALVAELAVKLPQGTRLTARLLNDEAPAVRLAAAIALASIDQPLDSEVIASLAQAAEGAEQHEAWLLAVGAVSDANVAPLLRAILERPMTHSLEIAKRLARRHAASAPDQAPLWLASDDEVALALAHAWLEGLRRARQNPVQQVERLSEEGQQRWQRVVAYAMQVAADAGRDSAQRLASIQLIALKPQESLETLRELRYQGGDEVVRVAAIEACAGADFPEHLAWLGDSIDTLPWRVALRSVNLAISRPLGQLWVLDAIASKRVARGLLPPADAERLLRSRDAAVADKAREVLPSVGEDRGRVIAEYRRQMPTDGDAATGHQLFLKHCAACHRVGQDGFHVGPDISDTRTQTPETLLVAILDPSRAIDAGFVRYSVLTTDGRVVEGLLIDDRDAAVSLRLSGGEEVTISREEIDVQNTRGVSLMPDGFEQLLPPAEMAHLISYLKNWRYGVNGDEAAVEPAQAR